MRVYPAIAIQMDKTLGVQGAGRSSRYVRPCGGAAAENMMSDEVRVKGDAAQAAGATGRGACW
jgi:hypothetical protein